MLAASATKPAPNAGSSNTLPPDKAAAEIKKKPTIYVANANTVQATRHTDRPRDIVVIPKRSLNGAVDIKATLQHMEQILQTWARTEDVNDYKATVNFTQHPAKVYQDLRAAAAAAPAAAPG